MLLDKSGLLFAPQISPEDTDDTEEELSLEETNDGDELTEEEDDDETEFE